MPFKSQAQRRLFYAKMRRGEMSQATIDKWNQHTPKGKKLPDHIADDGKEKKPMKVKAHVKQAGTHKDMIPGGNADKNKPGDFDKRQLAMGAKVEREHTNDPRKAQEIAMDHLAESPKYYTALKKMEKHMKKTAADPTVMLANALKGAIGGAIAGSRRSLDGKMLQGVAQGAAIGAVGGALAGEALPGSSIAPVIGGGLAGAIASRGPRGPSRPQLHLRMDKGESEPTEKTEKTANHGMELAGLGVLAAPTVYHKVTGKEMSEKNKGRAELAGLGTLAAGTLHGAYHDDKSRIGAALRSGVSKIKNVVKNRGMGKALVRRAA